MTDLEFYDNLLKECEENAKYSYITSIFNVFFLNNNDMKYRASKVMEKWLDKSHFKDICNIQHTRQWYDEYYGYSRFIRGKSYNAEDFLTYQMSDKQKFAVIVFASFHSNGYIRESALRLLKNYDNSLPYIAFRVNDWVEPIRKIAEDIFIEKIYSVSTDELINSLPYIYKLYYSTRRNQYILDLINKRFNSDDGVVTLSKGLENNDIYIRKICISLLLNMIDIDKYTIFANYLPKEREPFLRRKIYLNLIKDGYNVLEISDDFIKDKLPANRSMALRYIYENDKENSLNKGINMLLDKDASVRELSQRIVRELSPNTNIHEFYLKSINIKPQSAILGLSETGNINDCAIIEKYLYSDKPVIIRAAMTALLRLDLKKYQHYVIEMLLSKHCGVVKTAKLLIEKYYIQDFDRIYQIYQTSNLSNTRIKCLTLLLKDTKWKRLIYMLRALSDTDDNIRNLSLSAINSWEWNYNRSFVPISESEEMLIKELILKNEKYLGKSKARKLLFLIK